MLGSGIRAIKACVGNRDILLWIYLMVFAFTALGQEGGNDDPSITSFYRGSLDFLRRCDHFP